MDEYDIIGVEGAMTFNEKYDITKKQIEDHLLDYIGQSENQKQDILLESMKYSLMAGGKRFRPVVHLEVIKLFGGNLLDFIDSACALEYIHTYSLVHDDLPALDNDDYRRGKKTNHIVFGQDIAILAGDGLLNSAFEILFDKIAKNPNQAVAEACALIAKSAGITGMIGGQTVDIKSEGEIIDIKTLNFIHNKKTAALIECAILSAAIMMQASVDEKNALSNYASKLGLAFQISDDILDVVGNFDSLGKPIGSDEANKKSTFVTFYGLEGAKEILDKSVQEAIDALSIFDNKKDFLIELAKYVASREK